MLEGQLADFALADIFQLLALTKKSGELIVSDAQGEGRVVVRSGEVTFATADSRRLALGARLVASGLADDECLVRLAARQRADGPLGVLRALSEDEDISDDTLTELVRAEVEDAIFTLLGRTEGDFRFEAGEDTDIPTAATFAGEQLVGDAEALLIEWAAVADRLPEPDAVLSLNPQPTAPPQFDATAWRVIAHVDGRRSVRDVIDLVGGKAFATTCAIADLVDAGVLEAGRRGTGTIARAESRRDILRRLERELGGSAPTPAPADRPAEVAPPPAPVAEEPQPAPLVTPEPELDTTPEAEVAPEPEPEPEPEPAPAPAPAPLAVDRSAFARELASLGLDDGPSTPPPAPKAAPAAAPAPAPAPQEVTGEGGAPHGDQSRLSRDDDVSKGMLLRLIDGVKGA